MMTSMEQNEWKVQADNTLVVGGDGEEQPVEEKNWAGIFISLGIIVTVLLLVTVAAVIIGPMQLPLFTGRRIQMEDLQDPRFQAKPMFVQWLKDGRLVYMSEYKGIVMLDPKTMKSNVLVNSIVVHQTEAKEFLVSPNEKFVLLIHDIEMGRLYRRKAKYSVYDVSTDHYTPVKLWQHELGNPKYDHVEWAGFGVGLLIVSEGDLYYLALHSTSPRTLTRDAAINELYHGVPDILYEEVLEKGHAVWVPPSSRFIAAATFNDTQVRELPILEYSDKVYPTVQTLRYSTVDTLIPEVSLWVYDVMSDEVPPNRVRIFPPRPINSDHYLIDVGWVNSTSLWSSWLSRDQETSVLTLCVYPSWVCEVIHESHISGGASPVVKGAVWKGAWIAFPWAVKTLEGAWHNELSLISTEKGQRAPLSIQYFHVTKVLACDVRDLIIYFLGSDERVENQGEQVYSVSVMNEKVVCITCHLDCEHVSPQLNDLLTYAVVTCHNSDIPTLHIISLTSPKNSTILHKQDEVKQNLEEIALPGKHTFDIRLSPILHATVAMTLPPGFNELDDTVLLPLVVQMVGPGEPKATEDELWDLGWPEYVASGHHVAHARVQLWGFNPSTRESILTLSLFHSQVIKKLIEDSHFLDPGNIALYGWGSGASVILNAAADDPESYKCVAVVNPVTDWKAHSSYIGEKIMGSKSAPGAGRRYENSDLTRLVPNLKTTNILLVQGTQDPAAHHSFILAHALSEGDVHFKHVLYADAMYCLRNVEKHLLEELQDFVLGQGCLNSSFLKQVEEN